MAGRQAKIIAPGALATMCRYVKRRRHARRNLVIILLSAKAGLRAGEIAKLEWPMVLNAKGHIADSIEVADRIAKKGSGRRIPMHPALQHALADLLEECAPVGPVVRSLRGGHLTPNSVVNWFVALYSELGLVGCSSHSGRRTFITHAARMAHRAGGSLRDVQLLAGHRSIDMTQSYIDGDTDAQRRLVHLL